MKTTTKLEWVDDRWHLDGQGIHAGDRMEIRLPHEANIDDCKIRWLPVRIESYDRGQGLSAHIDIGGMTFAHTIETEFDELRWPT